MQLLVQRLAKAAVFAIAAFCSGQSTAVERSISFVLTDCWGNSIVTPTKIQLTSVEPQATEEWLSYPQESRIVLQRGRYHILIQAQGFFAFSSVIEIVERDVEVRNCLTIAPIEGLLRPVARLEGGMSSEFVRQMKHPWVRLVGVYSDVSVTVPVDTGGGFSFSRLRPGRYVLFLVDQSGIKLHKEVDIREPSTTVRLP